MISCLLWIYLFVFCFFLNADSQSQRRWTGLHSERQTQPSQCMCFRLRLPLQGMLYCRIHPDTGERRTFPLQISIMTLALAIVYRLIVESLMAAAYVTSKTTPLSIACMITIQEELVLAIQVLKVVPLSGQREMERKCTVKFKKKKQKRCITKCNLNLPPPKNK